MDLEPNEKGMQDLPFKRKRIKTIQANIKLFLKTDPKLLPQFEILALRGKVKENATISLVSFPQMQF